MRILSIPQIVTSEVASESDIYGHQIIHRVLRDMEPSHFYMWLRRGDEGKCRPSPDVTYFYEERKNMGFYPQMAAVNIDRMVDLFSWQFGYYPADVVLSSRAGIAAYLQLALGLNSGQYQMPVVVTEPRVYGPGDISHNQQSHAQFCIRAAGYASCYGLYWSKYEYEAARRAVEYLLSPGAIMEWDRRSFLVDALVDVDEAARNVQRDPARKRLIFAGRLNQNKRFDIVLDAYSKVLMQRTDIEVWLHSGTGAFQKVGPAADHRWHVTSERLLREDYWKLLGSSHVGAYFSVDEGANVTTEELLACGVVMALPDRPWVHKLFWPIEYPFLFKSPSELPALLDYLLDNDEECRARLQPVRELIERERAWTPFSRKIRRVFEQIKTHPRPPAFRLFRELCRETAANGSVFHSTLLGALAKSTRTQDMVIRSTYACYQAARDWDDCRSADPCFTPVKEEEREEVERGEPASTQPGAGATGAAG